MALRTYKLELTNLETSERVDFGPRRLGEVGRDILIAKRALGAVVSYQSLIENNDTNPSLEDPNGWFDCSLGMKVSNVEAATFDANMQKYLTKFQLDNQFYIISYLFTKFGVNESFETLNDLEVGDEREVEEYLRSAYTKAQMELIDRMYQDEFGKLGEATLAVLHGWRPRTRVGNQTYYHDPRFFGDENGAYDLVLLGLYDSFTQDLLTQKIEDSIDILEPRAEFQSYIGDRRRGVEFLKQYKRQVSERERIGFSSEEEDEEYVVKSEYFAGMRYRIVSQEETSPLFSAFTEVTTESPRPRETSLLSDRDFTETLRRAFEPDPLIDPEPFNIDSSRVGFFDRTDYTLENLPPRVSDDSTPQEIEQYRQAILALEDAALTKVLEFYNKPQVWVHSPSDGQFLSLYGYDLEVQPNHDGTYAMQTDFSLSTNVNIETYDLVARAENWSIIEGDDIEEPLIKFIEFRTPSLRPGDVYRAKFEINRKKLDFITDGTVFTEEEDQQVAELPAPAESAVSPFACDGEQVSEAEQERRFQEYKALAKKRKQEIARTIREKTLENYNNNQPLEKSTIDLGVFGKTDLDLGQNSYEFTNRVLNATTGLLDGNIGNVSGVSNPKLSSFEKLQITFADLESAISEASDRLKQAQQNCNQNGVVIEPLDYDANKESRRLQSIPGKLKEFVKKHNKKFDFGESESGAMRLSGFVGVESKLDFEFQQTQGGTGLEIVRFKAGGKPLNVQEMVKKVPALSIPRTVAYLAQIEQMSNSKGLLGSALSSPDCQKIGLGKVGLSYIVKHTIGAGGTTEGKFNPINKWIENNVEDPRRRWEEFKKVNDIEAKLKVKFGQSDVLSVFGDQCTSIKEVFRGFYDVLNPGAILCRLLQCLKLPAVDIRIPDFNLDLNIDLSIWGWYRDLIETLKNQWEEILTQFLCVFAKALLDILNVPFCQEQLRDQLYGSGASSTGDIKRALVEGLTDLSIKPENLEKAKQLIDEMALFLTGEELCRVLQGGAIDAATMNMILTLAERLGIDETNTEDKLRELFETIGVFLPPSFCENLSQSSNVIGSATCAETSTLLDQIRRRMLANDATDEEIQHAVDMANRNLLDQARAIEALSERGLNALVPSVLEFGNPEALVNKLPDALSNQINETAKSLFNSAHIGYVSSLSNFGPSLFLQSNRLPRPTDPEYNEESTIIVQTILENLKLFAAIGDERRVPNVESLTEQLHVLYQVYHLVRQPGTNVKTPAYYQGPPNGDSVPQDKVATNRYRLIPSVGSQAEIDFDELFLKPAGFRQNTFYDVDEEGNIVTPGGDPATRQTMRRPLSGEKVRVRDGIFGEREEFRASLLKDFSFIGSYKIVEKAEKDETILPSEGRIQFLQERIQNRIEFLQNTLQVHLQNIANPINEEEYLKILRTTLDFAYENAREREGSGEIVRVEGFRQDRQREGRRGETRRQTLNLNLDLGPIRSSIELNEFESTEDTNRFDPYTITINSSPLFGQRQTFEYCDTIPGPGLNEETLTQEQAENRGIFEEAIRDIPPGLYTRRELFARSFWESVKRKVDFIYNNENVPEDDAERRTTLNQYLDNFLRRHVYNTESPNFTEGIFEQIFFSLRDSRIYDESNYYEELRRRVAGDAYFSENEQCYKNRYNVSQFGILSFEKMVTDEISNEIAKEINKPENDPYFIDFDDLGPVQKAIQNVCLIGFVRVCIVELMLKGSLAYSVWDVEGVADEPFMRDFVYQFVHEEIKRHPSLQGKWQEVITRVTGIEQPMFALRDLVQKQLIKVQGASKKIFQNEENLDYYNWFVRYFVPQTEVSRVIANRDDAGVRVGVDGQIVGAEGQILEEERIDVNIPDRFYWEHPLVREENIIQDSYVRIRDTQKLANDLLAGNHPFFHIEHMIEVTGPLARLESLILPSREIIDGIIAADADNPYDNALITEVRGSIFGVPRRDVSRLNIVDAYDRVSLPDINIDEYNLRGTPQLPEGARGSSAEEGSDLNENHEIYHIDDFIDGLNSVLNGDDIEKAFLHYRGLMHYDENPADAPGGIDRNTSAPAANAKPEVIRRTPTRFITRKRRILKFSEDFISHRDDDIFPGVADYKRNLEGGILAYAVSDQGNADYEDFRGRVSLIRETTKYHVVPSNGEELLQIRDSGIGIDIQDDARFASYAIGSNGTTADNFVAKSGHRVFTTTPVFPDGDNDRYVSIGTSDTFGNLRCTGKDLEINSYDQEEGFNTLSVRTYSDRDDERLLFNNPLGTIEDEQQLNDIRIRYPDRHEETWVETVFDFSDEASIIAGIFGSFTIGETFDPAVLDFVPSRDLKEAFQGRLRSVIEELHSPEAYRNARLRDNKGTADDKLTQYGRVIYLRDGLRDAFDNLQPVGEEVYLARPMGLDRDTYPELTRHWTCTRDDVDRELEAAFFRAPLDGEIVPITGDSKRRARKLIMEHSAEEVRSGQLPTADTLLAPNLYKIPMRVLVTQVYEQGSGVAREVYCKVVPPKYIRDMHNRDLVSSNIDKLNTALQQIAEEYAEYFSAVKERLNLAADRVRIEDVREAVENFPDFCTDFTRDHEDERNESNLNFDSNLQYCSIERIYSRAFANETKSEEYNSEDELDALFQDRGALMVNRGNLQDITSGAAELANGGDQIRDQRHFNESYNHFYSIQQDQNLESNALSFHMSMKTLNNIFQWYLRTRRANTLWGLLTRPYRNLQTQGNQQYPLAHSFGIMNDSGNDSGLALDQSGNRGRARRIRRENYTYVKWASAVLKDKQWRSYELSGDQPEAFGVDGVSRNQSLGNIEDQPGFVTLYPGDEDIQEIFDRGLSSDQNVLRKINKTDLTDWYFYKPGLEGLISDGWGRKSLNYNSIEHTPIRNTGTSLFFSEGIISHLDISNFIKSLLKRIMTTSYQGRSILPQGPDPITFFDMDQFFAQNGRANASVLVQIVRGEDEGRFFDLGFPIFIRSNNFNPTNLNVNSETLQSLLTSLQYAVERLYELTSNQAAFCVQTEVTRYNDDILEAPYRLAILNRLLLKIKNENYSVEEKLMLLAVASMYDIPSRMASLSRQAREEAQEADDISLENVPDESLTDWAAACLHFLANRLIRGTLEFDNDRYDEELAEIFSFVRFADSQIRYWRNYRDAAAAGSRDQVRFIGGDPADPVATRWDRTRQLVLDSELTPKEIIKRTNWAYHTIWSDRNLDPSGVAGDTYNNNALILDALLDDARNPEGMIEDFGELYQQALSRANLASVVRRNDTSLAQPRYLINTQQTVEGQARGNISYSEKLENFLIKLDYKLFYQILGNDENTNSFAPESRYLVDYIAEISGRRIEDEEGVDEYYKFVAPRLLYYSDYFTASYNELSDSIRETHFDNVDRITSRWISLYERFTGITSQILGSEALSRALINGRVVRGLLENTEINQVSRLVANTFIKNNQILQDQRMFNEFISEQTGPMQEISEEFRSFYMSGDGNQKIFSVPMAEYKKSISAFGEAIDECYDLSDLRENYTDLQPWMADQLIETEQAKQIFQYIYPVKRYQAVSTAFVTSVLSGYSTMPSIMQTPKASLAALLGLAGIKRTEDSGVIGRISQAEFYKQITDNAVSDPKGIDCFGFPFPADFLGQFTDLLEQLFKTFPSIFFRGIANAVDPAYKEMRRHWQNCDIDKLTWSGYQWKPTVNEKDMTAGLMGRPDGQRDSRYSSILTSAPVDLPVGFYRALYGNYKPLRRALSRLTGYIIKGPIALLDQNFVFNIPCLDDVDATEWPGSPLPSWNLDRYGHPITPLTAIALSLPELPGEKKLRSCTDDGYRPEQVENNMCPNSDVEPPPFGQLNDPEED